MLHQTSPSFLPLETASHLNEAIAASKEAPIVLFKHSNACPISHSAYRRVQQLGDQSDPAVYCLTVQQSRALSNAIADKFNIKHESPQVLLIVRGNVVYDASHHAISVEAIRSKVSASRSDIGELNLS